MGMFFVHSCTRCGYEYEGTGGRSHGMMSIVYDTYNCKDCKTTFDFYADPETLTRTSFFVPVPKTFWDKIFFRKQKFLEDSEYDKIPNENIFCKNCGQNNVETWESKCPQCSGQMKMKSFGGMWD